MEAAQAGSAPIVICNNLTKPMKSFRKELWFETRGRRAFLNITSQVEAALKESAVQEGIALINAMHITASVFINDDEQGLHADYEAWLESWRRMSRFRATTITEPARTMPMPI